MLTLSAMAFCDTYFMSNFFCKTEKVRGKKCQYQRLWTEEAAGTWEGPPPPREGGSGSSQVPASLGHNRWPYDKGTSWFGTVFVQLIPEFTSVMLSVVMVGYVIFCCSLKSPPCQHALRQDTKIPDLPDIIQTILKANPEMRICRTIDRIHYETPPQCFSQVKKMALSKIVPPLYALDWGE